MPGTFDSGTFGAAFDLGQAASFASDETSIQGSRPIELYDFAFANGTHYRYASGARDQLRVVLVNGQPILIIFKASTIRRGNITAEDSQNVPEFTVELPCFDPLVQAYCGVGVPPQGVTFTLYRYQPNSHQTQQLRIGKVAGVTIKGRDAAFRIAAITDDPFRIPIPNFRFSKLCQHVLYDPRCTQNRSANSVATAIATLGADFRTITVASVGAFGGDPTAFVFGDLVHQPTGERRTIVAQTGAQLLLDVRLPNTAQQGDAIAIARGCAHDNSTCDAKFSNIINFGGHPLLVSTNFFYSNIATRTPGQL